MPDVDYYAVLGIERTATPDEVKAAYRRAVKAAHPDHGGSEGLFVLIQEAGDHLLDPTARASYDHGPAPATIDLTAPDPWAGNWSDTAVHSPTAPPSFAQPWWATPEPASAPPSKRSTAKTSRKPRSLFDHGLRHVGAPMPVGVLIARLTVFAFAFGFLMMRVLALNPQSREFMDRIGLIWTLLPLVGAAAAAWAIRAIRHDGMRYSGERTAWIWCVINMVCLVCVLTVGSAILHHAF